MTCSFNIEEQTKVIEGITINLKVTDEEFQNFVHRVTEVGKSCTKSDYQHLMNMQFQEKIVKKLASNDIENQEMGKILADEFLEGKKNCKFIDCKNLTTKLSRTLINKCHDVDLCSMSQESFMRTIEKDVQQRSESRKAKNERADTYKTIGNGAFEIGDYEKAVTYYGKAIEQRKDSSVIWNNRALSYMKLGLYEKALQDCQWALKVNNSNIKALLNSAKCYAYLKQPKQRDEFIRLAKERVPRFKKYIEDFEQDLKVNRNEVIQNDEKEIIV